MFRPPLKSRRGFTLIELLVVVIIIGILATAGLKGFASAQDRARNTGVISNTRTIMLGIENWKTDHNGIPKDLVGTDGNFALAKGTGANATTFPVAYVPGNNLPKGPWSRAPQVDMDGTFNGTKLVPGGGVSPVFDTDIFTNGQAPLQSGKGYLQDGFAADGTNPSGAAPNKRSDYGYCYYGHNDNASQYFICGVGKDGSTAPVIAFRTNFATIVDTGN